MEKMMLETSPEEYLQKAQEMFEKKDVLNFFHNINMAIHLVGEENHQMLKEATFFKIKRLFSLREYTKVIEEIDLALKCNSGEKRFLLQMYEGISHGYLGHFKRAVDVFKSSIEETEDELLRARAYNNIAWVHMTLNRERLTEEKMAESKKYLNLAMENFDMLSDNMKIRIISNYNVYYFLNDQFDKAIELLEDSIKYCEEKLLADMYNNLAENYLKYAERNDKAIAETAKGYLEKAEIYATKYKKNKTLGHTFFITAMIEKEEDQIFKSLDALYISLQYFKDANATIDACNTLLEIQKIMDEIKNEGVKYLKETVCLSNEDFSIKKEAK